MMGRLALLGALMGAAALTVGVPDALRAQPSGCSVLAGTRGSSTIGTNNGSVTHMGNPRLRCSDGRYMEADSLVHFQASGYTNMLGRVVFRTDGRELRAATARYFEGIGRLEADSAVELRDLEQGTVITGEELLYLRAGPQRPEEQLTVTGGRPRALLYPRRDTLREDSPPPTDSITPWEVVGDRIHLVGDQYFEAQGSVGVVRDSLMAFADSLRYDQVGGGLDLVGGPARVVQGALDLRGEEMRILMPGDVIEEVTARREALLTTDSLDVDAPTIRIFMADGVLDRLVAWVPAGTNAPATGAPSPTAAQGPPTAQQRTAPDGEVLEEDEEPAPIRARAVGSTLTMEADSLDLLAPAEQLQRMVAIGGARAVSTARDSINRASTPDDLLHDWIEGDTVRAIFEPSVDAAGTGEGAEAEYVLESIEARINARSLYRMDPDSVQRTDTTSFRGRIPVNYTEAQSIVLFFVEGEVKRMEFEGLQRGIQLQPVRTPADTARAEPNGTGGGEEPHP
ncbi:hypothetical protein WI460_02925 [Gemmatimonadota bacterium Y43]|uniref:hypothetical protein n=1 Tax=Gaopeijia maritima TaxID=3119007 RepID=UPI003281B44B